MVVENLGIKGFSGEHKIARHVICAVIKTPKGKCTAGKDLVEKYVENEEEKKDKNKGYYFKNELVLFQLYK